MKDLENDIREAFVDSHAPAALQAQTLAAMKEAVHAQAAEAAEPVAAPSAPATVVTLPVDTAEKKTTARSKKTGHMGFRRMRMALVAACLAAVLVGSGSYTALARTAYVSVDSGASIELGVNRFGYVVSSSGATPDAQAILDMVKPFGMTYEDAVSKILDSEGYADYLGADDVVAVTVCSNDAAQQQRLCDTSESVLATSGCAYECSQESIDVHHEAESAGISTGKYRAYLELQSLGSSITLDECRSMNMAQLNAAIVDKGGSAVTTGLGHDGEHGTGNGEGAGQGAGTGSGMGAGSGNGQGAASESGQANGADAGNGQGTGSGNGHGIHAGVGHE